MKPVILLVDDEESIRSALHRVFKSNNFQVVEAESGQAALDVLEHTAVDVIVSDQRMPGMSGTELLTKVKNTYPHIGRIMLSGQSDFDDLCDAINEANIYQFLPKPWQEDRLVEAVNEVIPTGLIDSTITTGAASSNNQTPNNGARSNKVMASIIQEAVLRHQPNN
jgi:DNA-binding NtrC family response regulator